MLSTDTVSVPTPWAAPSESCEGIFGLVKPTSSAISRHQRHQTS